MIRKGQAILRMPRVISEDDQRVGICMFCRTEIDTQRVFLYKDKPIRDVKRAFDTARRRAEITNLRLHDLRHTASTNLRWAGVDATTAMKIVGHKSERMHRRYNTVEPDDLRWAVSQLATCHANALITPEAVTAGAENVRPRFSKSRP